MVKTLNELQTAIVIYEKEHLVNLYKRSSRSIESHRKRCPKVAETANKQLVYTEIVYCCIHGGKKVQIRWQGSTTGSSVSILSYIIYIYHIGQTRHKCNINVQLSLSRLIIYQNVTTATVNSVRWRHIAAAKPRGQTTILYIAKTQ